MINKYKGIILLILLIGMSVIESNIGKIFGEI